MEDEIQTTVQLFFQTFPKKAYKRNEIIIRAQDIPKHIYYLTTGVVKEYFLSAKGEEVVVNTFKPGAFFPMSYAMNKAQTPFSFEAETSVEVYQAPGNEVIAFVKKYPDVLYDLLRRVFLGTDGLLLRTAYLMAGNARQRLITELLIHAKRFGRNKTGSNDDAAFESKKVEIVISEKELATQAGLTRETVSRELKQLRESGLADFYQGMITIPDLKKLEGAL